MTNIEDEQNKRFPGFQSNYKKGFWKYPMILESYWHQLTGAEQKALDFILRQTIGFQKTSDKISISQFVSGIGKNNKGTGVSKAQVPRALKSLEEKGFITFKKTKFKTTEIYLVLAVGEEHKVSGKKTASGSLEVISLIEMFKEIAPHQVEDFKSNQRQVRAMEDLVRTYTPERVRAIMEIIKKTNGMQYSPTIGSPVELRLKWAKLIMFIQKKREEEKSRFRVVF